MKKLIRYISIILIFALVCASFAGCAPKEEEVPPSPATQVLSQYMSCLVDKNYSSCYALLDSASQEKMTLTEFVTRHDSIYDAIESTEMTYEQTGNETSEDGLVSHVFVSMVYDCKKLGSVKQDIQMDFVLERGEWRLSWSPSVIFADMDWEDRAMVFTLKQKRGEILDYNGNCYAINSYADTVYVDLNDVGDYDTCAKALAPLLSMDSMDIVANMTSDRSQKDGVAIITYYMPGKMTDDERMAFTSIQGVKIDSSRFTPIRYYPQGSTMAHTLGYTSVVTADDLNKLDMENVYSVDSLVGRNGLEAAYEKVLAGRKGIQLVIQEPNERDEDGIVKSYKLKKTIVNIPAQDGDDIYLTIDHELQMRAEESLATLSDTQAGSIVVLDPSTGALLASASGPTYDLNIYADKDASALYNALLENSLAPLYNRVTRGLYPPGSTVKPLMAVMGLDSGEFTMKSTFNGEIYKRQWMPKMTGWNYPAITRVSNYDPPYNIENAIIHSDNIFFAYMALTCGWQRVIDLYTKVGFDEAISYDLSVAKPQIMSDMSRSNLRLLADTGYGQGELLVTPLQMASMFSLFANDGKIMEPYIVSERMNTVDGDYTSVFKTQPTVWRDVSSYLTGDSRSIIDSVMVKTMESSKSSTIDGITIAGKTGTAQISDNDTKEIAWWIVYVKGTGYERLVCVTLEVEADGGGIRYDVARPLIMP
ncbi:MAG: hypothetical protein E7334_03020 [Clostridiales bacterium]|nr:hypothetical protein [Clostridiales bacterium]